MVDVAKMDTALPARPVADDIPIGALLAACDAHPTAPLVFS